MEQYITCISEGVYDLTRGQRYELLAHDTHKEQVKVRSDCGRSRWFPAYKFDLTGGPVVSMTTWRFDDPVVDEWSGRDETNNYVDVVVDFDDGMQRWCLMATPEYLKQLLAPPSPPVESGSSFVPPGNLFLAGRNLIVVRDLATATVQSVLSELDRQDKLIKHTILVGPEPEID